MRKILIAAALIALSTLVSRGSDGEPKRDILGLHLAMTLEEAKQRLNEIGTFERKERKQQEIWRVRHPSFSHLIFGMSKEGRLRYITAIAREDSEAKRLPYSSIGDLSLARQTGDPAINNFKFEWSLPALKDQPEAVVLAVGRDPEFLSTYSLKRGGEK